MSGAREQILGRIRRSLADVPAGDETTVPRDYRSGLDGVDPVELFATTVAEYRATVHRCGTDEVGQEVSRILSGRGIGRIAVPADLPATSLPADVQAVPDHGDLSAADLDAVDGALTTAALGIALTGTLVLDGGPGQGRRMLSLVPDYHLCLVPAASIVGSVPEAVARLGGDRPLTLISGPSATSDIELNRVEGVHGPRTLDVLILG